MAYTNDPRGAEDADSEVAVVRKRTRFGPLFVSCRCMFVAGALGKGKEISMGALEAVLGVSVTDMAQVKVQRETVAAMEVCSRYVDGQVGVVGYVPRYPPTVLRIIDLGNGASPDETTTCQIPSAREDIPALHAAKQGFWSLGLHLLTVIGGAICNSIDKAASKRSRLIEARIIRAYQSK